MKGGEKVNLGIMQLSNVNTNPATQTKVKNISQGTNSNSVSESGNKFGAIFSKIMTKQNSEIEAASQITDGKEVDLNQLSELINSDSLEEVLNLLGIPHDDGLLMIQDLNDQSVKSVDELMNIEDLLSLLGMDQNQLQTVLQQFLSNDQTEVNVKDIWQLIQSVNEQGPNLVSQITTALQGEHKVTPKEAEQLLQLLKLAQIIGKNSDLLGDQPVQLGNLKEVMNEIAKITVDSQDKAVQTTNTTQVTTQSSTSSSNSIQGFQQVVKQVETTTETQQTISGQPTSVTVQRTVTLTLPAEKSAQGEALVKEVQQLIGRGQISNTQGTMKILLKLYPENLGSIRIEIMQKDGVLSARLLASTPQAKELLESQLNQLRTTFAQANIQMDRIDIAQSLQESDKNLRDQNLFSNFFKQQQEQENDHDEQHEDDEEQTSFQDYLINEGV